MLRSSRTMLSNSSSTSRRIDCARFLVKSGKIVGSGMHLRQARQPQPLRREIRRQSSRRVGSASMRLTCCSSTAGSFSLPLLASVDQLLRPGLLPHRKNDSRDASSRSLMR